jgi:glycosyltransferase involved in cell wall biosynthesis
MLLTIAIPTFNRNKVLLENLEILLPVMPSWAALLVIDNYSEIPVSLTVSQLLKKHPVANVEIIRNPLNIGGNANIIRCIENVESEYIWIIGDDDYLNPVIFDSVYNIIQCGQAKWVNFFENQSNCQPVRLRSKNCVGFFEFVKELKSISELVFVSTNIYKTSIIKNGVLEAYHYQSMMAPHLIAMLYGLNKTSLDGVYVVSVERPFKTVSNNVDSSTSWPLYYAFCGVLAMYRMALSNDIRKPMMRLIRGARSRWLNNKSLVVAFTELSIRSGFISTLRMTFDIVLSLLFVDRLRSVFSIGLYFLAVAFPRSIRRVAYLFKKKRS